MQSLILKSSHIRKSNTEAGEFGIANNAVANSKCNQPDFGDSDSNLTEKSRSAYHFGQVPLYAPDPPEQPGHGLQNNFGSKITGPVSNRLSFASGPILQRECSCGGTCPECRKKKEEADQSQQLQAKHLDSTGTKHSQAPALVHKVLNASGRALDPSTRNFMESRFGHDFSQVRVHTGSQADESARAVNARAYTVGRDLVFGSGQYAPNLPGGRRLLAHELAHVVQQAPLNYSTLQSQLTVGAVDTAAEIEADRVAEQITGDTMDPVKNISASPVLRRQTDDLPKASENKSEPDFKSPQKRGAQPRTGSVDGGKRGDDPVIIHVTRYLCDCRGRTVTEKHASTQTKPDLGFTLEFCRGRISATLTGKLEEDGASLTGTLNLAPASKGGVGANLTTTGKAGTTDSDPKIGGQADLTVGKAGGPQVVAGGGVEKDLKSGKLSGNAEGGVDILGQKFVVRVDDIQDPTRRYTLNYQNKLPGQSVDDKVCRECSCPAVYECMEDIPSHPTEKPGTTPVDEITPLRYYFYLNNDKDTDDAKLKELSAHTLEEVIRRVKAGTRVKSIIGYASPEDNQESPVPNDKLSLSRAKKLRERLLKLDSGLELPEPEAGGELLGRTPTIDPGSDLSDAFIDADLTPEDVSAFLIGTDIPNPNLSDQFLKLFQNKKLQDRSVRRKLFGIDENSPAAKELDTAIDKFIANKGRGRRPWENIFAFLRFATVQLVETKQVPSVETGQSESSLKKLDDTKCAPYAKEALARSLFGPSQDPPKDQYECQEPNNLKDYDSKCKYE